MSYHKKDGSKKITMVLLFLTIKIPATLLKYMLSRILLIGCLAKWVMLLSKFDIQYVNKKTIKGQAIVDHLADAPLVVDHPLIIKFSNEHLCLIEEQTSWKLYFDGSYTSHGFGAKILLVTL